MPVVENSADWPLPLTPLPPEFAHAIESQRADRANAREASRPHRTRVLYEDDTVLAVHKPVGCYCEAVHAEMQAEHPTEPLVLSHRLDRDTSGVMLLSRTPVATKLFGQMFERGEVSKVYVALCSSSDAEPPQWGQLELNTGHGRSRHGLWRVYGEEDVGRALPGGSKVRSMETRLVVEATHTMADAPGVALIVRAFPSTGRTHQIRLHCAWAGIPLVGDVRYGGAAEWAGQQCDHHHLHAHSLSFTHPVLGTPMQIEAPLPAWARVVTEVRGCDIEPSASS